MRRSRLGSLELDFSSGIYWYWKNSPLCIGDGGFVIRVNAFVEWAYSNSVTNMRDMRCSEALKFTGHFKGAKFRIPHEIVK